MPIYEVQCPEYSPTAPPHMCQQYVDVFIPVENLSDEGVLEYIEENAVHVPVCDVHGSDYERDAGGNLIDG